MVDIGRDLVKGLLVDHRIDEIREVVRTAHFEGGYVFDDAFFDLGPEACGQIGP